MTTHVKDWWNTAQVRMRLRRVSPKDFDMCSGFQTLLPKLQHPAGLDIPPILTSSNQNPGKPRFRKLTLDPKMSWRCERGLKPATTCLAETLSQYVVAGFSPRLYPSSTAVSKLTLQIGRT